MCDVTHSHVDVLIFLYIFTSKIIFSILQVSTDRKRLLTASVRHLSSVVYCGKDHSLETMKLNGCTVVYANFGQTFFATVRGYQWRIG